MDGVREGVIVEKSEGVEVTNGEWRRLGAAFLHAPHSIALTSTRKLRGPRKHSCGIQHHR